MTLKYIPGYTAKEAFLEGLGVAVPKGVPDFDRLLIAGGNHIDKA